MTYIYILQREESLRLLKVCVMTWSVHFAWQVWHGQLSPRFEIYKLKSFSGVEIDQNHVDKRILGGKGLR